MTRYNHTSWTLRFKFYASSVLFAHLNCFYRHSRYAYSVYRNKTPIPESAEWMSHCNQLSSQSHTKIPLFSDILHSYMELFICIWPSGSQKKKCKYLFKLGNSGTKRQLKVIKSQILNFVHILSKIGFLPLLLTTCLVIVSVSKILLPPHIFQVWGKAQFSKSKSTLLLLRQLTKASLLHHSSN